MSPLSGKLLFPFVAPPNAGKGTQTQILSQRYPLPTFDMGATFRAIMKEGADPEAKAELETYMNAGRLVPVRTVAKVFKQHFEALARRSPDARGFILDGFPRNADQTQVFDELCQEWHAHVGAVVHGDAHVGAAANRNARVGAPMKLDAAIFCTQAKEALVGLGWKPAIATSAIDLLSHF